MKMIRLKIAAALFFSLLLNQANAQMKMSAISDVIAKPSFEGNDAGVYMKVWVMSIINDMNENGINNAESDDGIDKSTHDVLVKVENENGASLSDKIVKLLMVSPTGKKQSVDLDPKNDEYGNSVAFAEKGEYQLTVSINADGRPVQRTFSYKIYR